MVSQTDWDQSGITRQLVKVYLGPSVGWLYVPRNGILDINSAGIFPIALGISLVRVNVAGLVQLNLPSSVSSSAGAQAVPGSFIGSQIAVVDVGGHAGGFPISLVPFGSEKIDGLSLAQVSTDYGAAIVTPNTPSPNWILTGATQAQAQAPQNWYKTQVIAQASQIPAALTFIATSGFYVEGDGGDALYKKVGSPPTHGGKFQSADGAWWELAGAVLNILQFGAVGDFNTDDSAAFTRAFSWLNTPVPVSFTFRGKTLILPPGHYQKTGTHTVSLSGRGLIGYGREETNIYQADALDSIVFSAPNPAADNMGGCSLIGVNIRRTNGATPSAGVDLSLIGQLGFLLDDFKLDAAMHGLLISGCDSLTVRHARLNGSNDIAALLAGSWLVKTNHYTDNATVRASNTCTFTDCVLVGNAQGGGSKVDYNMIIEGCDGFNISDCYMGNGPASSAELWLHGNGVNPANNWLVGLFVNNVYFDAGCPHNILASGTAGHAMHNHQFNNCLFSGSTGDGVAYTYATQDVIMTGNTFTDNVGLGLNIGGGAGTIGFTATANRFRNNAGGNIGGNAVTNFNTMITDNNGDDLNICQLAARMNDKTATINTVGKFAGKQVWVADDLKVAFATGSTNVAVWKDGANNTIYTPV